MLNSLRIERDRVALEAGFIASAQGLLRDVFPSISASLTGFFSRFSPDTPALALSSKQNDFLKEVPKHSYLDISALTAYVPEGLDVTYIEYAHELLLPAKHAAEVVDKVLSDFTLYLSFLISNKDEKYSSKTFENELRQRETARATYNKALGKCFKTGSTKTDVTIDHVIHRNSDWKDVFTMTDSLVKLMNTVDRKALNKKTAECVELLSVVHEKIKNGDFEDASPVTIKNIADYAYAVASELEFFSAMYYKVAALSESINRTLQHFENVYKH